MAKNIIFCADGTWNGIGDSTPDALDADATNVLRLFAELDGTPTPDSLRKSDEQEKILRDSNGSILQVSKYLHGVGDSKNPIRKILGGVFGEGFIERIVRGYTFVSREYEAGDQIFLIGFSRGAYTVRALAGMIAKMGLLPPQKTVYDFELAYRQGIYVWARYRSKMGKKSPLLGYLIEYKAEKFKEDALIQGVRINTVGVWDTVGALGIPRPALPEKGSFDVFEFADVELSVAVESGIHAVAIDEQRDDFRPTLWEPRSGVTQRWFTGAHADVGGGYASSIYAPISLRWMIGELTRRKLRFFPFTQPALQSSRSPIHEPHLYPPFNLRPNSPRQHPTYAVFDSSVQKFLDFDVDYTPLSLAPFLDNRHIKAEYLDKLSEQL